MRVFVVGATGVLGRTLLAELFAHGHTVLALARSQDKANLLHGWGAEAVPGDLLAPASFQHALLGVEAIVNLASDRPAAPAAASDWLMNDLLLHRGTEGLLAAARRSGVRYYMQPSSAELYRPQGEGWLTEDAPLEPAEELRSLLGAEEAAANAGIPYAILRAGRYYGDGAPFGARLLSQVEAGVLRLAHRGSNWLSLTHLFDMAKAMRLCLEQQPSGRIYNVCDDFPRPERDLLAALAAGTGARLELGDAPPPDSGRRVANRRLREEVGFVPYYPDAVVGLLSLRAREQDSRHEDAPGVLKRES